jgi:hypothetical protein
MRRMPPASLPPHRSAALLLVAALGLTGCGADDPVEPSGPRPVLVEPENPSVASAVADPLAPRILSVVVTEGELTGDTGTVEVEQNAPVRLVVISDEAGTVEVQGYDLTVLATAEVPVQLDFVADRAGEFRVVLGDVELLTLSVG